ncbi:MAG: restriction endonuclease subunit S [Campylobacter sp.]|nr:restriction endonuclease subunit S [Campylobacter sp.]
MLKLALEGSLSKGYRRASPTLCAFDEISTYNDKIKEKRKKLEKKLKICEKEFKLEKDKDKKALVKSQIQMLKKELTKCKEITPLNLSEAPFAIPNSWAWVKLGDICEITMGQSPEQNQFIDFSPTAQNDKRACHTERSEVSYFEFHQGKILFGEKFIEKSNIFVKGAVKVANTNSILLCVRAPVGIVNITQRKIAIGRGLCALKSEFCNNDLLYFILQSMQTYFEKKATGSTFKAINIDIVKQTLIPLPPLYEQQEITQTLDTLFTLKKGLRRE